MKLEIKSLSAGYGSVKVLQDVSLAVEHGEIIALLGPNGCGKSTLLKVIGRILKPQSGAILLDGKSIHKYDSRELAKHMAVLPQLHHASGELLVEELVAFGRFPHRKVHGFKSAHDREVIDHAIHMTRLEPLRRRSLRTLSGGERQRAWIAMTLAQEPRVLLLDEPTTFLDICCQFEIIDMVRRLNRDCGISVVMVLHDLNLAAGCADRMMMMKAHNIRYSGTPQEVMTPDILRDVFEIEAIITSGENGIPYCMPTGSARRTSI